MKLIATTGLLALMLAAGVGCGPGMSHRAQSPEQPPTDVFNSMDAELSHAMSGTTTVTSAEPSAPAAMADATKPAASPTWGEAGSESAAPVAAAAPEATAMSFDMHPYDPPAVDASFDMHPYD